MAACASRPDMVSTDKAEGETYSADEIRRRAVDQPFLLSGDFFRERNRDPEVTSPIGSHQAGASKAEAPAQKIKPPPTPPETAGIPRKPEASRPAFPDLHSMDHPIKATVVCDPDAVSPEIAGQIQSLFLEMTENQSIIAADQDKVMEILAASGCLQQKDLRCLTERLGVYPGIRMLILVEAFEWPRAFPGTGLARLSVVDAGIGYRYPPLEIAGQIQNPSNFDGFAKGVLQQALAFSMNKSRITPWFCRMFYAEGDNIYISAGQKSGLTVGDVLDVTSPGKLIPSPTGLPAGWIPGKVRGQIRVEGFFGKDFAFCGLIKGEPPTQRDLFMGPR